MDRRERAGEPLTALLAALQGWQAGVWTAFPGELVDKPSEDGGDTEVPSFDPVKRTVTIQPLIQARVQKPNGDWNWVTLPLLVDCPVFFPSGGGVTLTFPLRAGDECLVIFSSRCIDAWWQSGGVQNQPELRMHDLSDGFCFAGVSSLPNVIPDINATSAQLRNDSGLTYIELIPGDGPDDDPQGGTVNIVTELTCNVTAGGNVTVTTEASVIVNAQGECTVNAQGDVLLESGTHMQLTAPTIDLN